VAAVVLLATANEVMALTKVNFQKEVDQDHGALVEFYAPWFAPSTFLSPASAATTLL
jgi:protein disulfide-isomerase A6